MEQPLQESILITCTMFLYRRIKLPLISLRNFAIYLSDCLEPHRKPLSLFHGIITHVETNRLELVTLTYAIKGINKFTITP